MNEPKPDKPELVRAAVRLAFRIEGDFWNCYMAQPHTMDGAILLGSIAASIATGNPVVKRRFKHLMELTLSDAVKQVTGKKPKMITEPAPEHERTKE